MNTSLLACLRGAGSRLRPALDGERRRRPLRFRILESLRLLEPLATLPLFWPRHARFVLLSYPQPNSKAAAAHSELTAAGIPRDAIWHPPLGGDRLAVRSLRILARLLWAIAALSRLRHRLLRHDQIDARIILGRESFRRTLRANPQLTPIIISDVSPTLHLLWSAAAAEGNRALWWQDDFHHHWRLPYDVRAAAVLNEPGLAAARQRGTAAIITRRPAEPPVPLRRVPRVPCVGVATNASFATTEAQRTLLSFVAEKLGVDQLHLRLHPTRHQPASAFRAWPVQLAPADEPMAAFAARVDLVVVGNTAAQIWLLRKGVPVLHISGLDTHGFDLYGYVRQRFVLGIQDLEALSLDCVAAFYESNSSLPTRIREYTTVGASRGVSELSDLASLMALPRPLVRPAKV